MSVVVAVVVVAIAVVVFIVVPFVSFVLFVVAVASEGFAAVVDDGLIAAVVVVAFVDDVLLFRINDLIVFTTAL